MLALLRTLQQDMKNDSTYHESAHGFGAVAPMPASIHVHRTKSAFAHPLVRGLLPAIWHFCVLFCVAEYVMELRGRAWVSVPCAAIGFELALALSLCLFHIVAHLDPGIISADQCSSTGVEEVMRAID